VLDRLKQSVGWAGLRNVDYFFAEHLHALDDARDPQIPLAAALASHAIGEGNTCLALSAIADKSVLMREDGSGGITVPSLDRLVTALKSSSVVGSPGAQTPLILDDADRLYLGRYWWYEQQVAEALRARAQTVGPNTLDLERLKASLKRMFSPAPGEPDWQMIAAAIAALRQFVVISGGPGTGKTRTVTSILALLLEQAGDKPLRIALTAPTGKAAARLTESIRLAKPVIACSEAVRQRIPEEATTIHRLLGVRPGQIVPRYHADNVLAVDLLVVDEASMIDLPLMARLLAALPAHARLILLGDKDQLASVEAGSVFADISGAGAGSGYSDALIEQITNVTGQVLDHEGSGSGFGDSVALLRKSYRFTGEKGIGSLARAINAGDSDGALSLLKAGLDGVHYKTVPVESIHAHLVEQVNTFFVSSFASTSPREVLERFSAFRVLCAVRGGPMGVEQVNKLVEVILRAKGLITSIGENYAGRPIMVTRNDHGLGLFNGDVGILWPDTEVDGALRAWFILPDNSMKRVLPSRLPEHETAYAMTVHKSQGSEFERVLMLMPFEVNPVLTRELLYTGITRAKREVELWGSDEIIAHCIQARVERMSGLADKVYSVSR
jgi:exodeoxyribonuclease V alpha subunit